MSRLPMLGTAGFKALRVDCVIGIHPHERSERQPVLFDVEVDYDFGNAATSDAVADAADYSKAAGTLIELAQRRSFNLIETLAEESATALFKALPDVRTVRIEIRKPKAIAAAECAFVRVERQRR